MLNIVVSRAFIIISYNLKWISHAHSPGVLKPMCAYFTRFFFLLIIFFLFSFLHLQIFDLKPATTYVFLTRAENSYGLSEPSVMSSAIKTLANDKNGAVLPSELAAARTALSGKVRWFFFVIKKVNYRHGIE